MRRARSTDQKERRRQDILEAARLALAGNEPAMATMDTLAATTGLAKGTLYLYFRTKEEVYLAVLREDLGNWLNEVDASTMASGDDVIAALMRGLRERSVMTWLLARLGTILEANLDIIEARDFKVWIAERLGVTGRRIERALGAGESGLGARFCLWVFAVLVGLHQLAHPAPVVCRVIAEAPELGVLAVDFMTEMETILRAILAGLGGIRYVSNAPS